MPRLPSPHTTRRTTAALILALLVAACSPPALAFTIGECVNIPDGDEISDYEKVDCAEAHDAEVYALPQHPDGPDAPYPGREALNDFGAERCQTAFEPYVGIAYEQSMIYFSPLTPSQNSWESAADREVVCLLRGAPTDDGTSFEQLTGSKADSGE